MTMIYWRALLVLQIGVLFAPSLVGQRLPAAQVAEIPLTNLGSTLRDFAYMRESSLQAVEKVTGTPAADAVFLEFHARYRESVEELASRMFDDENFNRWLWREGTSIDSLERLFADFGLALAHSEGFVYADVDSRVLLNQFGPYLTPALREFLLIRADEEEVKFSDDAMLLITWDDLADRIATWEAFLMANPESAISAEARGYFSLYLHTYLTGLDNSRIFDWQNPVLLPQVRRSYERFAAQVPETEARKLVREYLAVLAASDYRNSDAVAEFLRSHNVRTMLGVQPPVR